MTNTRPGLYPYHDINGTNVVEPEDSLYLFSGYVAGVTPVPSGDHNGKLRRAGLWHAYLDRSGLRNEDWLTAAVNTSLTLTSLTYTNGGNVLTTGAVVKTRGAYLINQTRIETDTPFLSVVTAPVQGDPLVYVGATVPGRIWIYTDGGSPRFESVAAGTPDAPNAGEITLVGLDVDALGVVTDGAVVPVTLPLPAYGLPVTLPFTFGDTVTISTTTNSALIATSVNGPGNNAVIITADTGAALLAQNSSATDATVTIENSLGDALVVTGDWNITGDGDVTGQLDVSSYFSAYAVLGYNGIVSGAGITAYGNINSYGKLYVSYDANIGGDIVGGGSLTIPEDVTLCGGAGNFTCQIGTTGADSLLILSTTTFYDAAYLTANVSLCTGTGSFTCTIGTSSADTLTVEAAATFNSTLTCNGNMVFGNAAADTITVTGTVSSNVAIAGNTISGTAGSTVDVDNVAVNELRFDSDTTPSTTTGILQFFGRGLSVGLSSVARRLSIPFDNYVASLTGTAGTNATGATVTVTLLTGDVVYVEASADLWNSGTGQVIVFEIVIDGSIQNSPGSLRSDAVDQPITCYRSVKYTAVADGPIAFVQRYGADSGTTTGKNGFISVRQGN